MELYSEYYVSKKCERFVNKIWCLDNSVGKTPIENKLIVPNGCFNLAIVTGKSVEVHTSKKKYVMNQGVYFCSLMTNTVLVNIEPETKATIVQFHAWTISMFPKYDLSNFSNAIIKVNPKDLPFKDIIKPNLQNTISQLQDGINSYFEELFSLNPNKNIIEKICEMIQRHNEEINVSKIGERLNSSQRILQIKFKSATGLTIKKYIKILKFRKSVDQMTHSAPEGYNLTNIALNNKYFDQSHFIKDFKDLTKITPKMFNPDLYFLSKKR